MTDATNPTLEAALSYVARGWPVLPLKARSKEPATRHGKNDASAQPDQINEWFQSGQLQNIGIHTGVCSGLIIVDIDPRNGGTSELARLEKDHGKLPETLRCATGGGGAHHFFTLPAGIDAMHDRPNIAGYRGVDIKVDGYVVAAPSIHPTTGLKYQWENDAAVAEAPTWLINLALQKSASRSVAAGRSHDLVPEGGRNDQLFRTACGLRAQGASEVEIRRAVADVNAATCVPPLDSVEVESIVQSALRYDAGSRHADTDVGNARRLVDLMDGNVRYEPASRHWFAWDGARWALDDDGHIIRLAKQVADQLLSAAKSISDSDISKRQSAFALRSQAHPRITAMIDLAKSEPGVAIKFEAFDRAPHILNCVNGMIDLRSGKLMPHDRQALITQLINFTYRPDAECPIFEKFMRSILSDDQELFDYVHQAVGYSATGETREQCLFFLHGDGANGKSTFLNSIRTLLGGYAKHTPTDTLISKSGSASNDLARLAGSRFVTASEANADQKVADALLKQITGDEPIVARFLFKEFVTFQPQFKLFIATNQLPQINGSDPAMWRRIRTIPFSRVFKPEEQDRDLGNKLASESEGILAWIVGGAKTWYDTGLITPSSVKQANSEYRAEMDSVGQFIEERCRIDAGAKYPASDLYSLYRSHANDNGRDEVSATMFGRTLSTRGFPPVKQGGSKFRVGLTLNTQLMGGWS